MTTQLHYDDMEFIASARTDVDQLCAVVRWQGEEMTRLQELCKTAASIDMELRRQVESLTQERERQLEGCRAANDLIISQGEQIESLTAAREAALDKVAAITNTGRHKRAAKIFEELLEDARTTAVADFRARVAAAFQQMEPPDYVETGMEAGWNDAIEHAASTIAALELAEGEGRG